MGEAPGGAPSPGLRTYAVGKPDDRNGLGSVGANKESGRRGLAGD